MQFFFGDDSRQASPTREGMQSLIAAGGVLVDGANLAALERSLESLCSDTGFPANEEFKWSPGREKWMRDNLRGEERRDFYFSILDVATQYEVRCLLVVSDQTAATATGASTPDDDVTAILLERVHHRVCNDPEGCVVIVDRPSGGRSKEDRFLLNCLEQIKTGTSYVQHEKIALNVLSSPSKLIRALQLADLVTSCGTAFIGGEESYSPAIFKRMLPLFPQDYGRRGGCSIKIHPDSKYRNLYHWLLNDSHFVRYQSGIPFPISNLPYSAGPQIP